MDYSRFEGHTPGPWELGGPYPDTSIVRMIDSGISYPPEEPVYEPVCFLSEVSFPDRELMAAAPDLLAEVAKKDAEIAKLRKVVEAAQALSTRLHEMYLRGPFHAHGDETACKVADLDAALAALKEE